MNISNENKQAKRIIFRLWAEASDWLNDLWFSLAGRQAGREQLGPAAGLYLVMVWMPLIVTARAKLCLFFKSDIPSLQQEMLLVETQTGTGDSQQIPESPVFKAKSLSGYAKICLQKRINSLKVTLVIFGFYGSEHLAIDMWHILMERIASKMR